MTLAIVHSRAARGLDAPPVTVEVHLANGLPSFTLVGLADTEVKEARERVRAALQTSGLEFPHNRRVTVNLAPADLPKASTRFDLPIAIGILAAAGTIDAARLAGYEFAGELSLGGELRPVPGALAMALGRLRAKGPAAATAEPRRLLVLPEASAAEAALADPEAVRGARHLVDVVQALLPGDALDTSGLRRPAPPPSPAAPGSAPPGPAGTDAGRRDGPDLRDVRGQSTAKRALEIAAAGRHSLLMSSTLDPQHEQAQGIQLPEVLDA